MFLDNGIFYKSIEALSVNQDMKIVFNSLEGNRALCLLGKFTITCLFADLSSLKTHDGYKHKLSIKALFFNRSVAITQIQS